MRRDVTWRWCRMAMATMMTTMAMVTMMKTMATMPALP